MLEKLITAILTVLVTGLLLLIKSLILSVGKPKSKAKAKPLYEINSEMETQRVLRKMRRISPDSAKRATAFFISLWVISGLR